MTEKYTIKTSADELDELRRETQHGAYNGLHEDYKLNFTYKKGFFTIVAGPPASGKTEHVISEIMTFIERDNARVLVFSPESGTKGEFISMCLTNKYGGSIYKDDPNPIDEAEVEEFLEKYNDKLFVIDDDGTDAEGKPIEQWTLESIFNIQEVVTKKHGHVDYVVIDNLNDIKEPDTVNGRTDLGLEQMYVTLRRQCRKTDSHYIVVTHSSNQGRPLEYTKRSGEKIRYYPPITVREIRGGEANQRKGFNILALWRPPHGLLCPISGREYDSNETHIRVLKAKPKGAAIAQSTAVMFYNPRYSKLEYYNPKLDEWSAKSERDMIRSSEASNSQPEDTYEKSEEQEQEFIF